MNLKGRLVYQDERWDLVIDRCLCGREHRHSPAVDISPDGTSFTARRATHCWEDSGKPVTQDIGGDCVIYYRSSRGHEPVDFQDVIISGSVPPGFPGPPGFAGTSLAESLRKYRSSNAKRKQVPAYLIFHDKTLDAIVEAEPTTIDEFSAISGIGPSKRAEYGAAVVQIVKRHLTASVTRKDGVPRAANVVGSSSDKSLLDYRDAGCAGKSGFAGYWEAMTGLEMLERSCSFEGCSNDAEVGAHLWIKGFGNKLVCIAPACPSCNLRKGRTYQPSTRNADGSLVYYPLKRGTALAAREPTPDMFENPRAEKYYRKRRLD